MAKRVDSDTCCGISLSLLMITSMMVIGVPALGISATGISTAATTITVNDSGGADYTTIQAAVDNATTGDTVEVQPGTYQESVEVSENITLIAPQGATLNNGASPDRTFPLQPDRSNSAIIILDNAEPTIEGFTIRNYRGAALYAFPTDGDWTANDLTIQNVSIGLGASGSSGAWILDGVEITDATAGVYADDNKAAFTIRDTIIQSNRFGISTYEATSDWRVRNATITDNNDVGINAINTSGDWSVSESRFSGNGKAINASGASQTGTATHNWWGACDGPSGDFSGTGDPAVGNLAVEPYYTDEAQTTLSSETTAPCSTSNSSATFDFGVELWDPTATVTQGNDVTIGIAPNNNVDQPISGTTVELLVDANDDGQYTTDEVVASQSADFAASEYRRLNLTYANVQLAPGDYDYIGQISKDGQTTTSFTTGTLTVEGGSSGGDSSDDANGTSVITAAQGTTQAAPNSTAEIEYTIKNPTSSGTSVLIEFTTLPANLTIQSVSGDVAQDLTGSTPPGAITSSVPAGGTTTVTATVAVANETPTGQTLTVTASGTVQTGSNTRMNTTTTSLEITAEDPIVSRFGGSDGEIGNLDVLQAVNAANNNQEIGGEPVTNLDILQLVNKANE